MSEGQNYLFFREKQGIKLLIWNKKQIYSNNVKKYGYSYLYFYYICKTPEFVMSANSGIFVKMPPRHGCRRDSSNCWIWPSPYFLSETMRSPPVQPDEAATFHLYLLNSSMNLSTTQKTAPSEIHENHQCSRRL